MPDHGGVPLRDGGLQRYRPLPRHRHPRLLHLVAVRLGLLLGRQEEEHHGETLLDFLHRLRLRRPGHPARVWILFHKVKNYSPDTKLIIFSQDWPHVYHLPNAGLLHCSVRDLFSHVETGKTEEMTDFLRKYDS